jgi:hypothetical protein
MQISTEQRIQAIEDANTQYMTVTDFTDQVVKLEQRINNKVDKDLGE